MIVRCINSNLMGYKRIYNGEIIDELYIRFWNKGQQFPIACLLKNNFMILKGPLWDILYGEE